MSVLWELREASLALENNDIPLAKRYIAKALEHYQCKICHEDLQNGQDTQRHYKGWVHIGCLSRYGSRTAYLAEHV